MAPPKGFTPTQAQVDALDSGRGKRVNRKGLREYLDLFLGENANEAVFFAVKVMRGEITGPARRPGPGEDRGSVAMIPEVGPTIRERLDAAQWLAEMRNGKAPTSAAIDLSGEVNHTVRAAVDLGRLSSEQLDAAEKILTAASTVDAEFTTLPRVIDTPDPHGLPE
jgi:hypothetical protein